MRAKACPLDKKAVGYLSVGNIPKNFVAIELSKLVQRLNTTIKENEEREGKLKLKLKYVGNELKKQILNAKDAGNESALKEDDLIACIGAQIELESQAKSHLKDINCHSDGGSDLVENLKGSEGSITEEDDMKELQTKLLNLEICKPNDYLKECMSSALEHDSPCPQVTVNLLLPNVHALEESNDYYLDARLSWNPEAYEKAIIQDLIAAMENQEKVIAVKAPVNSNLSMLVKASLLAFLSKNECKNKIIYAKNSQKHATNINQKCLLCPASSINLPYEFVDGHFSSPFHSGIREKRFKTSITEDDISTSNSKFQITEDEFVEIKIRNLFFLRTNKNLFDAESLWINSHVQKKNPCPKDKPKNTLMNDANLITIDYLELSEPLVKIEGLLNGSFLIIDSWADFKKTLCDSYSFALTKENLNLVINQLESLESESDVRASHDEECDAVLTTILRMRGIFGRLESEENTIESIIDELISIAKSVELAKLTELYKYLGSNFDQTFIPAHELKLSILYLMAFIVSLLDLSKQGFEVFDDFCMAISPTNDAIYFKCLNPAIRFKKLLCQNLLAIITLFNSSKEIDEMSEACQISFDSVVSPKASDLSCSSLFPYCKGFVFEHLFGKGRESVTYSFKAIASWSQCHYQTMEFLLRTVQKALTVGGAVVFCPNIQMVERLQMASQIHFRNSGINLNFAHENLTSKQKCVDHEELSKVSKSILFVPVKNKSFYTERLKRHAARLAFFIGVPLESLESPLVIMAKKRMFPDEFDAFYYSLAVETITKALRNISMDDDDCTVCCFVDRRYGSIYELKNGLRKVMAFDFGDDSVSEYTISESEVMSRICARIN